MQFANKSEVYDAIVVGIGGHGSAIVANLAKSGQKVLGLEQFSPVHNRGRGRLTVQFELIIQILLLFTMERIFAWAHEGLSAGIF
jgi:choline dehydrogenase-like flavoprotein